MADRPERKSPRLEGYDYRQNGAYFVTICTHQRGHLFGEIAEGKMRFNALGKIASLCWEQIPGHFPHVVLDAFVVMPNHVHGIIVILDNQTENTKLTTTPIGMRHASSAQATPIHRPKGTTPGSLGAIIGAYK